MLGVMLTVLALAFIALRVWEQASSGGAFAFDGWWLLLILGLAVVYAGACRAQAQAWIEVLRYLCIEHDSRSAVRMYARTQLNKYIPGNVFHFIGRQAMGMAQGMPAGSLAKSMVWEITLLAAAAVAVALLAIPALVSQWMPDIAILAATPIVLLAAVAATGFGVWMLAVQLRRAFAWNLVFHLLAAAGFVALIYSSSGPDFSVVELALPLIGVYAAAWLLGFVTPGAPAGLGIREVVILVLLAGKVPEPILLSAVIAVRIVTLSGDVLFWLACGRGRINQSQ